MSPIENLELAEKVLRSIITHPEEHDQGTWFEISDIDAIIDSGISNVTETRDEDGDEVQTFTVTVDGMLEGTCGTAACIAGWAALHDGWSVKTTKTVFDTEGLDPNQRFSFLNWQVEEEIIDPQGEPTGRTNIDFEEEGRRALGISEELGRQLFYNVDTSDAVVTLYSLIKDIDTEIPASYADVAKHLGIQHELLDYSAKQYDDDLSYEPGFDEIAREVNARIIEEYPPFWADELFSI